MATTKKELSWHHLLAQSISTRDQTQSTYKCGPMGMQNLLRSIRILMTLSEARAGFVWDAEELVLRNDEGWEHPDVRAKRDDIQKICQKSFWQGIKVCDGFFQKVEDVLPFLKSPANVKTKSALMPLVMVHLKKIVNIADGKEQTSVLDPNADLEEKSQLEILAHFIKHDKADISRGRRAISERSQGAIKEMMKMTGTTIDQRYKDDADKEAFEGDQIDLEEENEESN